MQAKRHAQPRPSKQQRCQADAKVQLATLVDSAPEGDAWLHEIKLDGYRVLARVQGDVVTLETRNGKDLSPRAPSIVKALRELDLGSALFDGEVVALRDDGISDFQRLQNALGGDDHALMYFIFDLLAHDGVDLRSRPLEERKAALRELLEARAGHDLVRYSDHVVGDGPAFFRQACAKKLEGIVSKRRDARYVGKRTRDWLKVKCSARQELVIGGYTAPRGARTDLGAILVGAFDAGVLRYAGKVGTGFDNRSLRELHAKLSPLQRDQAAFANPPRGAEARDVHWVTPKLVAEVAYTEVTSDGRLRHPSFKGLREDKSAKNVVFEREQPAPDTEAQPRKPATRATAPTPKLELTNPDKVLYPEQGITKRALAEYYLRVGRFMLPHVASRPLTLLRCPEGRKRSCFFAKHPQKGMPASVQRVSVEERDGTAEYACIDSLEGLLGLVQMGALEIHTWGSHMPTYDKPDLLVIDLDPDPSVPWRDVVEAAELVRDMLAKLDLQTFVKTTGGKGLHVACRSRPSTTGTRSRRSPTASRWRWRATPPSASSPWPPRANARARSSSTTCATRKARRSSRRTRRARVKVRRSPCPSLGHSCARSIPAASR